jgi:hypothetical protein
MTSRDEMSGGDVFSVVINHSDRTNISEDVYKRVVELVAQQIATDILENDYSEIVAKISPEAIATMALAESGAKIHETLQKKLPDKVMMIEKNTTHVIRKGLFG